MAKNKDKILFVCQNCGHESYRWIGKCPSCQAWNSFVEERISTTAKLDQRAGLREIIDPVALDNIKADEMPRITTRSAEFKRVLGGGLVPGSVVLVGGSPGIGKSTLLLQEAANLSSPEFRILYVTGEESVRQTKMRADRLKLSSQHLYILPETDR